MLMLQVPVSWRRAREHFSRAIELGDRDWMLHVGLMSSSEITSAVPYLDKRVKIKGVVSRPEINGQCGTATDFHPGDTMGMMGGGATRSPGRAANYRYTVELDSGEKLKVKQVRGVWWVVVCGVCEWGTE